MDICDSPSKEFKRTAVRKLRRLQENTTDKQKSLNKEMETIKQIPELKNESAIIKKKKMQQAASIAQSIKQKSESVDYKTGLLELSSQRRKKKLKEMKKYCEIYRISLTETICELSEPQKRRG